MKTFKITYSENWKYTEYGYIVSENHLSALSMVADVKKIHRINNSRFRDIETVGRFYIVEHIAKGGANFIYEKL